MFGLKNFMDLPLKVGEELQSLLASINTYLDKEHNEDGSHKSLTTDTLSIRGVPSGVVVSVPFDAARFEGDSGGNRWVVGAVDFHFLRYVVIGEMATVWWRVSGSSFPDGDVSTVHVNLPELNLLPAPFDDGGGLQYSNYCGGSGQYSDGSGQGSFEMRALPNIDISAGTAGIGTVIVGRKYDATDFTGVSNDQDLRGFCTFPITPGNAVGTYDLG